MQRWNEEKKNKRPARIDTHTRAQDRHKHSWAKRAHLKKATLMESDHTWPQSAMVFVCMYTRTRTHDSNNSSRGLAEMNVSSSSFFFFRTEQSVKDQIPTTCYLWLVSTSFLLFVVFILKIIASFFFSLLWYFHCTRWRRLTIFIFFYTFLFCFVLFQSVMLIHIHASA